MDKLIEAAQAKTMTILAKVPRWQPDWRESEQQMKRDNYGDYVEFDDCKTAVELTATPPTSYSFINNEELADLYIKLSGKTTHTSDCATSIAPAETPGPCDCTARLAAESASTAPLNAADQSARNAGCNCSRKIPYLDFSHEKTCPLYSWTCGFSTAQLDAEDPAEPVEDVVERVVCRACGMAMIFRRVDTKTLETFHTCTVAREGYYSLEDVETAIEPMRSNWHQADQQLSDAHIRIAALEKLCQKQHEALKGCYQILGTLSIEPHCSECGELAERGRDVADAAITAYAALFPKAGGAK